MIPRTFPSSVASNGSAQMIVYFLPSVSGLTRWVDYIPVQYTTASTSTTENTYNQNGYIPVASLSSISGLTPFKEYVPVYLDSSATDVWKVNITGFIPVGTAGIGGAALYMDFSATTTLDPRVTFSRTSNATLTNSAGLVSYAPHNLLTYSEQFDNAAWTKTAATVSANSIAAPDGTSTADKLVATAVASTHTAAQTATGSTTEVFSVYAKASGYNWLVLQCQGGIGGYAWFDISTGAVGQQNTCTGFISSVGNGWYRCSIYVPQGGSGLKTVYVTNGNGVTSFTGDGTSGIYLWGAQLEIGSTATTYNPTMVKNLLGYTSHFDNAAWTKSNASITSGFTDIYGQLFAQKLVENTATNVHSVNIGATTVVGTPYTVSVYVKAAERSWCVVQIQSAVFAYVNLTTGAVGTTAGSPTVAVTSAGNGWYRISVTSPAASTALSTVIYAATGDGTVSYTGDGTSGIYIFGAQLSDSASVDPYVYNPVAAPTAQAYYGPRFDYDPVTLAPKGLLIEEQRTNLLLNSAVLNTQAVTTTATAHTLSFYGTGTIVLSGSSTGTVAGTGAYPTRTTLTFTPIVGVLTVTVTGSVTMAQLEAGSFATSYIPTEASQVTRAADSASMIGNNFSRWYSQSAGTLYAQFSIPANKSNMAIWQINESANARWGLNVITDNTFSYDFFTGSAGSQSGFVAGVSQKVSVAIKSGSTPSEVANGVVSTSVGSLAAFPSNTSTLYIGSRATDLKMSGTIARIAFYNRQLSPAEQQGITA